MLQTTLAIVVLLLQLARPQAREGNCQTLNINTLWHVADTDVGTNVGTEWVGKMIRQVLQWSLSCSLGLEGEGSKCNHGQTPILDLLCLHFLEVSLGETKWVKDTSWISWLWVWHGVILENWVRVDRPWLSNVLPAAELDPVHEKEFPGQKPSKIHLSSNFNCWEVLWKTRSIPPLLWVDHLLCKNSCHSKHGPSGMYELSGSVPCHGLWISSKTDWIKSTVSSKRPIQIRRRLNSWGPQRTVCSSSNDASATSNWARGLQLNKICQFSPE